MHQNSFRNIFKTCTITSFKSILLSLDEITVLFTLIPSGAKIYFLSPSSYSTRAILADLFGSYSTEITFPEISSLFLLKSIILYLLLWPPPLLLEVILPKLFLPPVFLRATVNFLSAYSL